MAGHELVQLVETLWYKPEGGGFDTRWGHWIITAAIWSWGSTHPL